MRILGKLGLNPAQQQKAGEFLRFMVVGVIAAGIHYGVYYLLQHWMAVNPAYTAGYLVSLICNFFMTAYFTFRTRPSLPKVLGFGFSHLVNYGMHMGLLNLFLWLDFSKIIAPILTIGIAAIINFFLLRFFFRRRSKEV